MTSLRLTTRIARLRREELVFHRHHISPHLPHPPNGIIMLTTSEIGIRHSFEHPHYSEASSLASSLVHPQRMPAQYTTGSWTALAPY